MDSIVDNVRLDCVDSVNGKDYNLLDIGDFDLVEGILLSAFLVFWVRSMKTLD